jgi:hypothetical protein
LIVLQILLFESVPQGRRENIAGLRIQTAAKGVNSSNGIGRMENEKGETDQSIPPLWFIVLA